MLRILIDHHITNHSKNVVEAIATLSSTVMNCFAKLSYKSPDGRKRANLGECAQAKRQISLQCF